MGAVAKLMTRRSVSTPHLTDGLALDAHDLQAYAIPVPWPMRPGSPGALRRHRMNRALVGR